MKLYIKFSILIVILFFLFLISFYYSWTFQLANFEKAHQSHKESFSHTFDEIVKLKTSKFYTFGYDYSYWDEMVDFLNTKDEAWAKINLEQALDNFDVDCLFVLNKQKEFVYKLSEFDIDLTSQLNQHDFNFETPIINSYFIKNNACLTQIFVFPIQKSEDIARETKPFGYLIIGKNWDNELIESFSLISQQTVKLVDNNQNNGIDLFYPLNDYENNPIAYLSIEIHKESIEILNKAFQLQVGLLTTISLIAIIIVILFVYIIILRPMNIIKTTLENKDMQDLDGLIHVSNDEFGLIAKLVKQFFIQNQQLELTMHTKLTQEKILIQQTKLASMGEMIGNIAHQWRQPLNNIALLVQDLKDANKFKEVDESYIDTFTQRSMQNINFMSKTIDDFRNFFKPNKEVITFDVVPVIQEAIDMSLIALNQHNIEILQHKQENEYLTLGYQNEFKQVVINILKNSIDAIYENKNKISKPTICINIYKENGKIVIEIEDNAGGIPNEIIDKVFEPYFTTKGDSVGTGIGLYMSKVIIETNMNGELSIKNTNNGACFIIKLFESTEV